MVQAEVRDRLSRKDSGISCQELGSVYPGQGERNVTRRGLGCGWPRLTDYNKSRYSGYGSRKGRRKTKAREKQRKTFLFLSLREPLPCVGVAETMGTRGREELVFLF